jgi:SAM-dependent methyltransferase
VGCNWGRWSIGAARAGFRPLGLDPSLGAVLAAKRLTTRLGLKNDFIVSDARSMPLRSGAFDVVFSFGVLQHFSREAAREAYSEMARVLNDRGYAYVQMAARYGLRSLYQLARRRFHDGRDFDVRYWSLGDLRRLGERVGKTDVEIECFFGLGIEPSDMEYMSAKGKAVVRASEMMRGLSRVVPALRNVADSVYLRSVKPGATAPLTARPLPSGREA